MLVVPSQIESPGELIKLVVVVVGVSKRNSNNISVVVVVEPESNTGGNCNEITLIETVHLLVTILLLLALVFSLKTSWWSLGLRSTSLLCRLFICARTTREYQPKVSPSLLDEDLLGSIGVERPTKGVAAED